MYREHDNKSVISLTGILLLTLLIGASVWIPAYLFENSLLNTTGSGALYRALTPLLTNISTYVPIVAWVVMLGISMAQCWQCAHLRLVKNTSLLPILLNVLLFGVFLSEKGISPGLPASICLYIAFVQMITPCSYEDNLWRMVETGFFVALASLFAPTYVLYIPVCWMGMQMLNKFNFPALLASIIGMMVPYILLFGFWFLTNQSDTIAYQWEVLQHQFCLEWLWTTHETILLIIIGITLLKNVGKHSCSLYTGVIMLIVGFMFTPKNFLAFILPFFQLKVNINFKILANVEYILTKTVQYYIMVESLLKNLTPL
jgi:hypothetical protein